jgi:hypothetical protein
LCRPRLGCRANGCEVCMVAELVTSLSGRARQKGGVRLEIKRWAAADKLRKPGDQSLTLIKSWRIVWRICGIIEGKKKVKLYSEVMIVVLLPMKRSNVPGWGSVVQSPSDLAGQSTATATPTNSSSSLLLRGG